MDGVIFEKSIPEVEMLMMKFPEVKISGCRNVDDESFVAKQGSDSGVATIVMQMCLTTKPAPLACVLKNI